MFDDAAKHEIGAIARSLRVEESALLAVAEVESGGQPFATVNGKSMPLIRWEGHYFYRSLPDNLKQQAVDAKLASQHAGGIPNPSRQQDRYDLLDRAKAIHDESALSSCSWGLGQVMGSHWNWLGFASARQMVDVACSGIGGQVELMARFIRKSGLTDELRRKDWAAFARAYNGPSFRVNRYDIKMADAYGRYSGGASPPDVSGLLRIGSTGLLVSQLQENLRRAGYFLHVDGDFGTATRKAVMDFQRDQGLEVDGVVGAQTWSVLERLQGVDPLSDQSD